MAREVRAVRFESPPYLPLRLVAEQLDSLEGLWSRRPALVFHKRLDPSHLQRLDDRLIALLDGLRLRREEAIHEATLRLVSPVLSECATAARVLPHLDVGRVLGHDGQVSFRPRRDVIHWALRCAPRELAEAASPSALAALELRARHGLLTPDELIPHLDPGSPAQLTALRAAALVRPSDPLLSACLRVAFRDPPSEQAATAVAHALFALGVAFACAPERAAFPALVDAVLGDALFDRPLAVRVMAVFGDAVTARRVAARARSQPSPELAFCLGLVGFPAHADMLADWVTRGPELLASEAVRALHTMSGEWAVGGPIEALRDDGKGLIPDAGRARVLARKCTTAGTGRLHLGHDVTAPPSAKAPASLHWLHEITVGAPNAAWEVPEGLLEARSRPSGLWELGPQLDGARQP